MKGFKRGLCIRSRVLPWIFGFLLGVGLFPGAVASVESSQTDLDGNGTADIVWRNTSTGDVAGWLLDGLGVTNTAVLANVPLAFQIVGFGDLDSNGTVDAVWRDTSTGDLAAWFMNGLDVTASGVIAGGVPLDFKITGVGDLDGNGTADLIWRNASTGDVAAWLMDGLGLTRAIVLANVPLAFQIVRVGDLDGNGTADFVWRNTVTGDLAVWLMDGTTITASGIVAGAVPLAFKIVGVGDLDGNGTADLIWRNTQTGDVVAWLMNGLGLTKTGVLGNAPVDLQIVGVGDLDGNGTADILWRNTSTGDLAAWLLNEFNIFAAGFIAGGVPLAFEVEGNNEPGALSPLRITSDPFLRRGNVDEFYNSRLRASGGLPPLSWSLVAESLPEGLTLNPVTGEIRGIPTIGNSFKPTFQVQDSTSPPQTAQQDFCLDIRDDPPAPRDPIPSRCVEFFGKVTTDDCLPGDPRPKCNGEPPSLLCRFVIASKLDEMATEFVITCEDSEDFRNSNFLFEGLRKELTVVQLDDVPGFGVSYEEDATTADPPGPEVTWRCSPISDPAVAPPCKGVTVDKDARTVTLVDTVLTDIFGNVLGTGRDPIIVNGTFSFPPFELVVVPPNAN